MTLLLILAHPDPASLNHALAQTTREALQSNGHKVNFHDLCTEQFDPFLPAREIPENAPTPPLIRRHCDELRSADGIIIVHPNWWGQPPAILKGWIDRVIRPGVAYRLEDGDSGEGVPIGLLKAHTALILNTSNTPDTRERDVFGDPLENIWKNCIFNLCGVGNIQRRMFNVVITSTDQQRQAWLDETRQLVHRLFPPQGS